MVFYGQKCIHDRVVFERLELRKEGIMQFNFQEFFSLFVVGLGASTLLFFIWLHLVGVPLSVRITLIFLACEIVIFPFFKLPNGVKAGVLYLMAVCIELQYQIFQAWR
jgi:hypothetical protein